MRDVPSSAIFCSSLILMLPGICLVYFSKPFFISPGAPITTGIVVAYIPHIRSISISRSLNFDSFSVTLTEVFFSVGMDINYQWVSSFSPVCLLLQCLVCWLLSHGLSVLAYPTRLWCCLFLLLLGVQAHTISLVRLYLALCICSSVGMRRLCHVCVGIQFWPAQGTLPRYHLSPRNNIDVLPTELVEHCTSRSLNAVEATWIFQKSIRDNIDSIVHIRTNSTQTWRQIRESIPGHIGGRRPIVWSLFVRVINLPSIFAKNRQSNLALILVLILES